MDPLLERELELVAVKKGVTKSQFVIEAVERALGRRNPYDLMVAFKVEEERAVYNAGALKGVNDTAKEVPYEASAARDAITQKLKGKHGVGGVWLATDTGVNRIMTMDERDFSRYRYRMVGGFRFCKVASAS